MDFAQSTLPIDYDYLYTGDDELCAFDSDKYNSVRETLEAGDLAKYAAEDVDEGQSDKDVLEAAVSWVVCYRHHRHLR